MSTLTLVAVILVVATIAFCAFVGALTVIDFLASAIEIEWRKRRR